MCGIIGILGHEPVASDLVDALRRLEYRGYDSAGIATLHEGQLDRRRAEGKLNNLQAVLHEEPLEGCVGIGHTRWATHGAPTTTNAHPHMTDQVALVHNGIIENFAKLRRELIAEGAQFATETDTEVVAHLLHKSLDKGATPKQAVLEICEIIEGAFAFAIIFKSDPDLLVAVRRGSPVAIGLGDNASYVGSDAIALSPFTNKIVYLEEDDIAFARHDSLEILDINRKKVERPVSISSASAMLMDKGNHRHFMMKEIYEQSTVVGQTMAHYVDLNARRVVLREQPPFNFRQLDRVAIAACGTAFFAGMIAKYWFEQIARIPVDIDIASEFRYREVPMAANGLALFISQSGETADTLATLRYCKNQSQYIGAVCNVSESTIARESDVIFPTLAGPEIGVASTKAFTCQLMSLACLVLAAAEARNAIDEAKRIELTEALAAVPRLLSEAYAVEAQIEVLAKDLAKAQHILYLGRGTSYPLAMEGALKLKEISYIHAEGYAAGELKHGPIALIDENMPVVVIAPYDSVFEKTRSNIQEVAARGGQIILITDEQGAAEVETDTVSTIVLPTVHPFIAPIVHAIPMQLLAYHTAVALGTDIDQPRNLAKSVTVE